MNMLQRILDAIAALAAGLAMHVAEMRKQQVADADLILLRVREVGDQVRRQADLAKAQGEALAELRKQQVFDGDFARAVVIDSAKWHLQTIDLLGGMAQEQVELRTALRVEASAILQKIADRGHEQILLSGIAKAQGEMYTALSAGQDHLDDALRQQSNATIDAIARDSAAIAKILAVLLPPEAATATIEFEGATQKGEAPTPP